MVFQFDKRAYAARRVSGRLLSGTALLALSAICATSAYAQTDSSQPETVVVTGTSIKGVAAPVGSNLIQVGIEEMQKSGGTTINQILSTQPALTGFGTQGNEFNASFGPTGESMPVIHHLGAGSSQNTLILVDGHPLTPGNDYSDPASIPVAALERVDILPTGASAVYGSSAVAGVINFVTKSDYEGFDTKVSASGGDSYNSFDFSQIWGHQWDTGGFFAVYEYKSSSRLTDNLRSFSASADLRSKGGTNYDSFNCSPATVSVGGNAIQYPYGTANNIGSITNLNNANCDYSAPESIVPSLTQHIAWMTFKQTLTSWLDVKADFSFSTRENMLTQPQGTITATAFGPTGSSALEGTASRNPYYVAPAGGSTASETVYWNPQDMIGANRQKDGARYVQATTTWTAQLPYGWKATLDTASGYDDSFLHVNNVFCTACALLALNGTTTTSGGPAGSLALADPFGLGTSTSVARPLTTANALDVWNPAGSANHTSATVIQSLTASSLTDYQQSMNDLHANFSGSLFDLPAGPVRAALGGEWYQLHMDVMTAQNNGAGPTIADARFNTFHTQRVVDAAYVEFYFPIIGADMHVPLIQSLEFDLAGRYDKYSDVGSTRNPRAGFNWTVTDGLSVKGSWGTSFTAPNIDSINPYIIASVAPATTSFTIPTNFPGYASSFCGTLPVGTPCTVSSSQPGINVNGGNPGLKPAVGMTYSFSVDWDGGQLWDALRGFGGDITYWQAKLEGGVTQPPLASVLSVPALNYLFQLAPVGGWTPTSPAVVNNISQFGKPFPVTSPLPSTIYYIYNGLRENAVNLQANGIDFTTHYIYPTDDYGTFETSVTGAVSLRYDIAGVKGAPYQSYLNGHQNTSVLHDVQVAGRWELGWALDPFEADLFVNYTNPYWYSDNTARVNPGLVPEVGAIPGVIYDKVASTETVDLSLTWNVPTDALYGFGHGLMVNLYVQNLLNSSPPFVDLPSGNSNSTQQGYDSWQANPIGRSVKITLEKKW